MFTGIVQDIGIVHSLYHFDNTIKISIETKINKKYLSVGASIACNGCCLTVTSSKKLNNKNLFTVDIGPETLACTNFRKISVGSFLNLEPALRVGDSLSGHQVTGHIDFLSLVLKFSPYEKEFWNLQILIPNKYINWIIPKGSISIAGISLTVANIFKFENSEDYIAEIMIIPHTFKNTILQYLATEMSIEVEFDQTIKAIASITDSMLRHQIQVRK